MRFLFREKAITAAEYIRNLSVTRKRAEYLRTLEKSFLCVTLSSNGTLDSLEAQLFLIERAMEDPLQMNK